jgi:ribosomal protein S12 methylthiotransferase
LPDGDKVFHLLTLGCPKNDVDSDLLISMLEREGWRMEERPEDARVLMVNTCSFIVPAVEESIEAILEISDHRDEGRRKLVVTGCLVSRYGARSLASLLPEVDLFVDICDYGRIATLVGRLVGDTCRDKPQNRVHSSTLSRGYVYIKISEGCRRRCAYCAIPGIRGPLRSRTSDDIREEGRFWLERGAYELILIGQDTTSYGLDLYGKASLPALLTSMAELESDHRLRIMYMHPEGVDDATLRAMRHPSICAYLDLPFQHVDAKVLRNMGRDGDAAAHHRLLGLAREYLIRVAIRATFMVGFPGETREAFNALHDFIAEERFDWLGLFSYSQEEGTAAFSLGKGVKGSEAGSRLEELRILQEEIMRENALAMVGRVLKVLVEGRSLEAPGFWEARSYREAPEIDGVIFLADGEGLYPGATREVEITATEGIDLVGVIKAGQEQDKSDKGRG